MEYLEIEITYDSGEVIRQPVPANSLEPVRLLALLSGASNVQVKRPLTVHQYLYLIRNPNSQN